MAISYFQSIAAGLLIWVAVAPAQDQTSAYSHPQPGEKVLSFYSSMPKHAVAVTHSGDAGLGLFPADIPRFDEPGIRNGLLVNLKLADKDGTVVGFASEIELFPEASIADVDDVRWQTGWALAISGRGMIFLEEIESSRELGSKVIKKVRETGKDWVGDWKLTSTVGPLSTGRGRIVGGTGEFATITGSFVELTHLTGFGTKGDMTADIELRLFPQ